MGAAYSANMLNLRSHLRDFGGFTLIEAMVTVAVLAILVAVGMPSLQAFLQRSAMRELQSDFSTTLQRARLDAISRNSCVSMCPLDSNGAEACEQTAARQGNWHQGWIVFANATCAAPAGGVPAAADIIQIRQPGRARYTLIDQGGNVPAMHTFNARGLLRSTGRTLLLADANEAQSPSMRCLSLNMQGRLITRKPNANGAC